MRIFNISIHQTTMVRFQSNIEWQQEVAEPWWTVEVRTISEWLSDNTWYSYHQDMAQRRADNTGRWFVESDEFNTWITDKCGRLWVTGMREFYLFKIVPSLNVTTTRSRCGKDHPGVSKVPARWLIMWLMSLQISLGRLPAWLGECCLPVVTE